MKIIWSRCYCTHTIQTFYHFFLSESSNSIWFSSQTVNMRWTSIGVQKWIVLIGSNCNRIDKSGKKVTWSIDTIEFDVHWEFSLFCVKVSKNTTNGWGMWKVVADVGGFQLETDGRWARGRPLLALRRHNFTPWQSCETMIENFTITICLSWN